jgi:hypothetical protein
MRDGFYLSTHPIAWEDISLFAGRLHPSQRDAWGGVALCRVFNLDSLDRVNMIQEIREWGEGGLLLGDNIYVVGDPKIVQRLSRLGHRSTTPE